MLDPLRYYFEDFVAFSWPGWLATIAQYNEAVFPAQFAGVGIGLLMLWHIVACAAYPLARVRLALLLLGAGWIFIGGVLHLQYLLVLDWTARTTGWIFILQGISLAVAAGFLSSPVAASRGPYKALVILGAVFGLSGFALAQWIQGQSLYQIEWPGTGSGSTALMTVAIVMLLPRRFSLLILVPWLWSLRQFTISWPLQDYPGMLLLPWFTLCGLVALVCPRRSRQQEKRTREQENKTAT